MSSEPNAGQELASDLAISVRNVGKCYHIYDRPKDRLKQFFWKDRKQLYRSFWALHGVTFDVRRGEAVGIIGRNGSGKSTLLQIIAGTLSPNSGEVLVQGRIAAILELGSGFNAEFTGRENVYLSAAIMGLPRDSVDNLFDEIAAFADIGDYIDQPVKTYSSGMFARLAFAVSVCVQPDILIVDEILAVGDMAFQQKCVARMRQMREDGLTLLFVSHSSDTVKSVCDKGLFLIDGQTAYWGPAEQAVNNYYNYIREITNREATQTQHDLVKRVRFENQMQGVMRYGTGHVQLQLIELYNEAGEPARAFGFDELVVLEATLKAYIDTEHLSVSVIVRDMTGIDLMGSTTFDERVELPPLGQGEQLTVRMSFRNVLHWGNYGISVAVHRVKNRDYSDNVLFDQVDGAIAFASLQNFDRPIHYKFHNRVDMAWQRI